MVNRLNKVVAKPKGRKVKPVPVKIVSDANSIAPSAESAKWRAQDDLRVLQSAAEIQRDRSRLKAAKMEAKAQVKALSSVCK